MTHARLPRTLETLNTSDLSDLFKINRPDFYHNAALGYISGVNSYVRANCVKVVDKNDPRILCGYNSTHDIPLDDPREPTVARAKVRSTSADDTGLVALVGTDENGSAVTEVVYMEGLTERFTIDFMLSVNSAQYLGNTGLSTFNYNVGDIIIEDTSVNAANDVWRTMTIPAGANSAANPMYRCPKELRAIIPSMEYSVFGDKDSKGVFTRSVSLFPGNFSWDTSDSIALEAGTISIPQSGAPAMDGGDFFCIAVENRFDGKNNTSYSWRHSIIEFPLDDAPPGWVPEVKIGDPPPP